MTTTEPNLNLEATASEILILLDLEFGIAGIDQHDELLVEGYLDSMCLVELILAIEETFGVTIAEDDLSTANFATAEAIARLITADRP